MLFRSFFSLIVALAEFERLAPPDANAKSRLFKDCFSEQPRYEAYLYFIEGIPAAYAITVETYSSFLAKPTLYLEDIFVLPKFRREHIGTTFFNFLKNIARERNCGRMEWHVLDWNSDAINFYKKIGATQMNEWYMFRLTEEQLR